MQLPYIVGNDVPMDAMARPARVATPDNGGIVGQSLERAGAQIDQVGQQMGEVAKIQAGQAVLQKRNDYDQTMTTALYGDGTPQNPGLMSLKGAAAAGAMQKYNDINQKAQEAAMDGVNNPMWQNQLKNELQQASIGHQRELGNMITEQTRAYSGELMNKRVDILAQQAALTEDPAKTADLLNQARQAATNAAVIGGASPGDDIAKEAVLNANTAVYSAQMNAMLESKDPATRAAAYTKYQQVKDQMSIMGIQAMDQKFSQALPQIFAHKDVQDVNQQYPNIPLGEAKINELAATKPPMYQKEFKDMLEMRDSSIRAQVLQNQQQLMDQADQLMNKGVSYTLFPPALKVQLQNAGMDQNYQTYNPRAPSNPDVWTYLNNLAPKQLATINLNTPSTRLNLSPQDYQTITQRQQSLSNPQALATENDIHNMVRKAATQMGIDLHEKYDYSNLDENGNPAVTITGNQDFISMNNLVHQGIAAYSAKHNGQYPDTPEVQKIVDSAVMSHAALKTNNWFMNDTYSVPVPTYKLTIGAGKNTDIAPDDVKAIAQYLRDKGVTPTNEAIINMYAAQHRINQ